ncbi:MAG TPA: DinB family protein [Gemmatimonadales bacterium]|nr:DinB family protein [Gemmatimonadales bacterium]
MDPRRLWDHARWADMLMLSALEQRSDLPDGVLRELSHIFGADEVWLARLTRRPSRSVVWPDLSLAEAKALGESVHAGFDAYFETLGESGGSALVPYTNSAGVFFETPIGEILLHVPLHAQYHRGKINQLLRQAGQEPVPADFISFSRGVPAAITRPGA